MKIPKTMWLALFIAAGAAMGARGQTETKWTIVAGKDDFTDESYYLIAPELPNLNPEAEDSLSGPVTEAERQRFLADQQAKDSRRAAGWQLMMQRKPGEFDKMVMAQRKATTARERSENFANIVQDHSAFLRPFVAVDNGVLLVGATTFGECRFVARSTTNQWHSLFGTTIVELRIDGQETQLIDPDNNPPDIKLPGAGMAARPMEADSKDGLGSTIRKNRADHRPYAIRFGAAADELLDRMVEGKVVKLRRSSNSTLSGVGPTCFSTKTYQLNESFREAIAKVGLVKDPKTGKWGLDPQKEKQRSEILAAQTAP